MVLAEKGIGHHRIRPRTPEDNSLVERTHRTVAEVLDEYDPDNYRQGRDCVGSIVDHYNNERLHSAIHYLRPIDYYRGDPERLLAERQRKIEEARHRRKEENLNRRQRALLLRPPQWKEPQLKATAQKSIFA